MRTRLLLPVILIVATAGASASALARSPRLSGPPTMSVLQRIAVTATGLRDGRYALFIVMSVRRNGRAYRCVAYLSAVRPVDADTERFYGSVPDGVVCRRGGGAAVDFTRSIPLGRYRLHVCQPTPAAYCSSRASHVARAVTIRR
jgi:hypothetical protein